MTKANALQAALSANSTRKGRGGEPTTPAVNEAPKQAEKPATAPRSASREGKKNVSAWLDPAYSRGILMVRAVTGKDAQDLIAEALNDLFAKYDVPQVRAD